MFKSIGFYILPLLFTASLQADGIPVFDRSNMAHQLKELAHLVEQIRTLQRQLDQAEQQYKALTGHRGFGRRFYDPNLRKALPLEWRKVYDSLQEAGQGARGVQDILQKERFSGSIEEMQKHIQDRRQRTTATHKAMGLKAYQGTQARLDQIESLMDEIDQTDDPKAIAELQARIAIEQAAIENEMTKIQLISQLQRAEDQLIEEQKDDMSRRMLDPRNTKMPEIKPRERY